jgi:hypothetical protein
MESYEGFRGITHKTLSMRERKALIGRVEVGRGSPTSCKNMLGFDGHHIGLGQVSVSASFQTHYDP